MPSAYVQTLRAGSIARWVYATCRLRRAARFSDHAYLLRALGGGVLCRSVTNIQKSLPSRLSLSSVMLPISSPLSDHDHSKVLDVGLNTSPLRFRERGQGVRAVTPLFRHTKRCRVSLAPTDEVAPALDGALGPPFSDRSPSMAAFDAALSTSHLCTYPAPAAFLLGRRTSR